MSRFRDIRGTCDTVYRKQGVGTEVKHAAVISSDEEDRLWLSGCKCCVFLCRKNLLREGWGRTEKTWPFPVDSV